MTGAVSLPDAAIYYGHVMHCRLRPFRHRFVYRMFSLFADIDALDALAARTPFFSHNRLNLFSLMDRDHGLADGSPLRPWIEALSADVGINLGGGRIFMLCFPRMFGFVFNPLTIFFCFDDQARLRSIIYEVRNTFGEKHPYVAAIDGVPSPDGLITHQRDKNFYVSPFIDMNMIYTFRLRMPGEKRPFNSRTLMKALCLYPLMSLKIIVAIHFEALRLWRKGTKFIARTPTAAT